MSRFAASVVVVSALAFVAPTAVSRLLSQSPQSSVSGKECAIKGNVSISTGEHIYHVPGQKDYRSTIIRPEYGERWFCSEADARAAGWRKAGR
ncbi:MAG: hypothetical protein COA37_01985 [Hoeflea sp.]|nr:hypothetical protein [Hoeflea sp.]PHR25803.1 MAG: hypothetical protein COA37_01985 [Hoeflea sp.]